MVLPALHRRAFALAAATPGTPPSSAAVATKSAYLLWEPRVVRGVAINYAALFVAFQILARSPAALVAERAARAGQDVLLKSAHRFQWWAALSLLSSSCCVLQLALNLLSVGCAGFNAVLGPTRPLFLALALHARRRLNAAAAGAQLVEPAVRRANAVGAAAALVVALAPELVALVGMARRRRQPAAASSAGVVRLAMPSMGCVACVDAVSRAVRSVDGVVSAEVTVGAAEVSVAPSAAPEALEAALRDACASAGFEVAELSWVKGVE